MTALAGVVCVSLVVAALASLAAYLVLDRYGQASIVIVEADQPTIVAQVDGEVATPGTYPLPAGARLGDLIDAAGGLTNTAAYQDLNLAARVGDGELVLIASRVVTPPSTEGTQVDTAGVDELTPVSTVDAANDGLVNINSASLPELETLPGIGPVLGERIINYREENGPFQSVEELVEVEGISTGLLTDLRPLITIDE